MNRITFKRKAEKSLLLMLFMFVLSFQVKAQPPSGGLGTEISPYIIATLDDLKWIADEVNNNSYTFSGNCLKQMANIDASPTSGWNSGAGWIAIGAKSTGTFSGNYYGQGYTISNLYINNPIGTYCGLFGYCANATIKDLGLTNVSIIAGDEVGGLAGYMDAGGTVSSCYVTGVVSSSSTGVVGGLLGEAYDAIINDCYVDCTISEGAKAGGLIGMLSGGSLSNSYASGSILASKASYIGGLIGGIQYSAGVINSCYSSCAITISGQDSGGKSFIGGLVGYIYQNALSAVTISDCYATGSITGTNFSAGSRIGGFIGENTSTVSNCYTTVSIPSTGATTFKGAFTGENHKEGPTDASHYGVINNNCYWNSDVYINGYGDNTGATFSATGKTTAAMQSQSTFTGWNFTTPWKRLDTKNNKYPYLEWQVLPFTAAVSTTAISTYDVTSATMGGNITVDGGATVTERGVVYSLASANTNPQIGGTGVTKVAIGTGIGSFNKSVSSLTAGTSYYVNAYATNSAGTSYGTATNFSTLVAVPTVTGISPINGPTTGTTSVTITGADLTAASAVMFGGTNATGFTVNSATQITVTAPAGSAGTVHITVTTAGGTSATSSSDRFTYVAAPTITGISTTSGPTAGSTSVVITGTNFLAASAVKFGSTNATGYTINSATQITATSPAGSAGAVDITVTTAGGTSATSSSDQFTYVAAPTITGISTTSGPTVGSTSVVITGTNFLATSAVKFGSTNATSFAVNSATQITATSPTGSAGAVDITVTTAGGTSATSSADQFTYMAAPTVTGISPTSGPTAGGTSVVITGTNLTAATAVKFGSTNATGFTVNSATQITATAPARSAGVVDVTVTTAGGTSTTSTSDQFTYVVAPTVTTNAATTISSTGATLAGSISAKNASTTVTFEYGLTTSYGTTVTADQSPVTGSAATSVSKAITGLTAGTTYYYRVVGVNAGGRTNGLGKSFTTPFFAGNGTPADPYPIATLDDLKWVSEHSDIWNGSFVQTADIDASTTSTWNASKGFSPIGDVTTKFTGSYNGQYHTITGLTINRPGGNDYNIGLFGVTSSATLKNIGLPDCSIIGGYNVGALVGYMGYNSIRTSSISDCYCTGEVSGTSYVGGLVGANQTTGITNSYSTCKVTALSDAAGLVSYNMNSTIANCFYDKNTSGQSDNIGKGTPKTTAELKEQSTFTGWDFAGETANGTIDIWAISSTQNNGYPCFKSQITFPTAPTVTTQAITGIATTTATGNGNITGLGVPNPGSRGVCWGTNANPTITDNSVANISGTSATGAFTAPITGLTPNTLYHVRAYATNSTGTVYGTDVSFTTQSTSQTISFGALDNKTYGDADYNPGATSATSGINPITYSSSNEAVATIVSGQIHIVGAGTTNITAKQAGNTTYNAAPDVPQQLIVNKRTITLTADAKTKTYGNTDPTLTAQVTSGTIATGDNATGSLVRTTGENVADYAINKGTYTYGSNYDETYVGANLTIGKRAITLTADPKTKTYGNTDPTLTAQVTSGTIATGDVATGSLVRATGETVADYAISKGTYTYGSNYDETYVGANLSIGKRAITLTADAKTKTYGNTDPTLTAQVTSGTIATGDHATGSLVRTTGENVADYAINKGTYTYGSNYDETYVGDNLTIGKRAITLSADPKTKTYGNTDPTLTAQATSGTIATGDHATGSLVRATGENVADYAISKGTYTYGSNYDETFIGSNLTIGKRAITLTADPKTKTYGNTDPTLTTQVTSGTISTGDHATGSLVRAAGETVADYAISKGTYTYGSNYDETYVGANLTIGKLSINVTAVVDTKKYDGTNSSSVTPTYNAFVNGDVANTVPVQTFDNATVGATHVLTASGLTIKNGSTDVTSNYDISYMSANGNITAKPLTITAPAITLTKVYDGNNVAAVTAGKLSGIVSNDAGMVAITAVANYDNANVGTNKTIKVVYTLGGSAAGNYSAPADFVATGAQITSNIITLEPLSNPTPNTANTGLVLSFSVVTGGPTQYKITFETAALAAGIQNVSYTAISITGTDGSITLTVPKGTKAGKYKGTLQMRNEFGVESTTYAFVLTVNIPAEYIAIKYNRVLVLNNSTKVFMTYQWYKDGVAIEGATKQFYRDPKGLVGTYTVQATTIDGEIVYSDPKVLNIPLTQKVTAYPSLVRANQTCTVEITDGAMELDLTGAELSVYSSQGIRVYYSNKVETINTIQLPTIDGMYSGRITTADGQSFLFKVIVAN